MFLKTLTLKGFKSFAEATAMELEPGVTVVVGPNGSGKSNVVDAIAWVLGAQAPSAVRSQKMDDVIFAGTSKRSALGRAEVSLTLDNSAGLLPIDLSEVSVTRTLFRTGESEYAINGAPCRLLDVQELLSDAGVGRQQHVIVSQGQIDAVLNARPEDRRAIIEEAAGVLKYRKRKERAERRLESTEGNLLRVQDLLREVRRQLRPLEKQAAAARRHGEVVAELRSLQIFLAGREIAGLRVRLDGLDRERVTAEAAQAAAQADLHRLTGDVLAAEGILTVRGGSDLGESLVRVEQVREHARGLLNVIDERRRALERDRSRLIDGGVVANLEADAARLRAGLTEVEAELGALEPQASALTEDEERFAVQRAAQLTELEAAGSNPNAAASAAAEVRGELRSLRASAERAGNEHRRLSARSDALRARADHLAEETARLVSECEQAELAELPLVGELEQAEGRTRLADEALAAAIESQRAAAGEHARWTARAEALTLALDSARARAGAADLAGLQGVLGTLVDLVEIDEGYQAAFEAAAGEAMLAVICSDQRVARAALDHIARGDGHGAVLSLEGAGFRRGPSPEAAGTGSLRSRVRGRRADVDGLLDRLLDRAVVVADWPAAIDVVTGEPGAIVVTADGHRFSASGWRLGAASGGATAAAAEAAQANAAAAAERLAGRDAVQRGAAEELAAARRAEQELTRRLDAHDARFTASAEGLARARGERREVAGELETVTAALAEIAERIERERARIAELEVLVPRLEADESAEAAAARGRGAARARLEQHAAALAARRRDLAVRNAGLGERRALLERRLEEAERRLQADVVARAEATEHRLRVERTLAAISRLAAFVADRREVIEAEHARLQELRRRQGDEVRALTARLEASRRARTAAEQEVDSARDRLQRIEIEASEARLRLEGAVESLRQSLGTEPAVAEAADAPVVAGGVNPAARVSELERELRLMGPINPLALEEFTALQERHAFLEEQLDDVRTTRRELLGVIRAVDAEIQSVFAAAFADVAANFTTLFATLFPGGSGRLVLTNPDDLLGTGIEVEAKPSGKNVKKLSLLSGGERSLTALAYLFAVFRSRPSPFYVMDEVEAALDDVNLHRFLGLVQEFRNEAQLLIVSHQKRTMEAADCLLGVTMQPGGSSKVIVERAGARA